MLSCEPLSDAALADALALAALALPDAVALAAPALADADPPEDEQPANNALPAKAAPAMPVSLITSRLEYEWFNAELFIESLAFLSRLIQNAHCAIVLKQSCYSSARLFVVKIVFNVAYYWELNNSFLRSNHVTHIR